MTRINDDNGIVCATCGSNDIVYADTGTPLDGGFEIKEGIVYAYKCKQCGNNSFVFYQIAGISRLNKTTLESVMDGKLPEWEDDRKAPVLTEEVFYRPDCPKWAQYAAVSFSGTAYWYERAPIASGGVWQTGGNYQEIGIYDCSNWFRSVIVRPPSGPTLPEREDNTKAPEFTDAVFSLPDCPDWAQYAAVDSNGIAFWYKKSPSAVFGKWLEGGGNCQAIDGIYHCSDWSKSLIPRPANTARLPYWYHQGSYVYSKAKDKYAIITDIIGEKEGIYLCDSMSEVSPFIDKSSFLKNWEYVNVAPYEWFAARHLVGTTIRSQTVTATVMGYDHEKKAVLVNNVWMKPHDLILHGFFTEDGKPCGSIVSGDPKNE